MNAKYSVCLIFMLNILYMQAQSPPAQQWKIGMQGGTGLMLAGAINKDKDFYKKMTGIQSGVGLMLLAAKEKDNDFYKKRKRGNHFGADIHYMFDHWGGIGVKYSGCYTSADAYVIFNPTDGLTYKCLNMEERAYVNFTGLSFYAQQYLPGSEKLMLAFGSAFGYAHYRDEVEWDYYFNSHLLKTSSFGFNLELSLEYSPLRWMSVGAYASYFGAWFRKGTLTDRNNIMSVKFKDLYGKSINASRLDLSIGIRFHL